MTTELPQIKLEETDKGMIWSILDQALRSDPVEINRATADSPAAKQQRIFFETIEKEVQRLAQTAFVMGVSFGRANAELSDGSANSQ
jgi:hypothetical protein